MKKKYHFKMTAKEGRLVGPINEGKLNIKILGDDYKLSELLAICMNDKGRYRDILARAVRRYARNHPDWWEGFKNITDLQLSDPPHW